MKLTTTPNNLHLSDIHPRNDAKYSPNLYKWIAKNSYFLRYSKVYVDANLALWIGTLDGRELIGCRLIDVLCNGSNANAAAWQAMYVTEVEDFWDKYTAIGRCAIDAKHKEYFIGDANRWVTTGDKRNCQWCGSYTQIMKRWKESVECESWVAA